MIVSALRGLVSLAVDAAECLLVLGAGGYARVDELWADTRTAAADRLADVEAEHEVTEPCNCPGCQLYNTVTRGDILQQMTAEAAEDNAYRTVNGFVDTRTPPTPSTAGVAPNPAVEDARQSTSFPTAGHPNLTAKELQDAAHAIRVYAFDDRRAPTRKSWQTLAERFENTANAMK